MSWPDNSRENAREIIFVFGAFGQKFIVDLLDRGIEHFFSGIDK